MGSLYDALGAFAGGFRDGVLGSLLGGHPGGNGHAGPSAESLCAALGWDIDERDGRRIGLHFRSPQGALRKLYVFQGGPSMLLAAHSNARIPIPELPAELFAYLLHRNGQLSFPGWEAHTAGEGRVGFTLTYTALAGGLTPAIFKYLCESMVAEAAEFDAKLEQAGLLA